MKIRHHEIIPNKDNPFAECKLGRELYAQVLTEIVNTYTDGFVLAINNEWGTGKTTFVKMWQQQLKNNGFNTIYFNAWENDFDINPLVAVISELETLTNAKNSQKFKTIIEKGAVLVKNIAPAFLKAVADKYIDSKVITDVIENTSKASAEILEEEIKAYTSKKKTIIEFRNELEAFVKQSDNSKPLIFLIDELDRCRPNYAVEVLEQIKHFFSIPGIVFVLSIDKNHLSSAVKGFYGSEQIDSVEYLRRFIDLEYSLPVPETNLFVSYLYEYYDFDKFFSSVERKKNLELKDDGLFFKEMAILLFNKSNATLRQQERIFAQTRLILCSFKYNEYTFSHLLFILVYIKIMKNELFLEIERNQFTLQQLSDTFFELISTEKKLSTNINILFVESLLLWFYNNDSDYKDKVKLIELDDANNFVTSIKSKLENKVNDSTLVNCFNFIKNQWNYDKLALRDLIKKINLVTPLTNK